MTDGVKAPGRGVRIALAVSVALNLAVAGVVVGGALKHRGFGGHDEVREIGFGPFTEALNREDRQALRKALLARAPNLRAARQEMLQDIQSLLTVLRAEPFDPAALNAVMQAQSERMAGRLDVGQAVMRDFLTGMTPEARRDFADRLEERLRHGGADAGGPDAGGPADGAGDNP